MNCFNLEKNRLFLREQLEVKIKSLTLSIKSRFLPHNSSLISSFLEIVKFNLCIRDEVYSLGIL